jgi:hypothetical protein
MRWRLTRVIAANRMVLGWITSGLPTIQGLATLRCAVRLHPCDRLRKMMLKELQRRNYAETAIDCYVRAVDDFSRHFNFSLDCLSYLWEWRCPRQYWGRLNNGRSRLSESQETIQYSIEGCDLW